MDLERMKKMVAEGRQPWLEGKIHGFGTHDELLVSDEIYREVYESQTQGGGDFDENGGEA